MIRIVALCALLCSCADIGYPEFWGPVTPDGSPAKGIDATVGVTDGASVISDSTMISSPDSKASLSPDSKASPSPDSKAQTSADMTQGKDVGPAQSDLTGAAKEDAKIHSDITIAKHDVLAYLDTSATSDTYSILSDSSTAVKNDSILASCTRTPGYWQTHSIYGPAAPDATWNKLVSGADTPFFSSGKTYIETLLINPLGNAYYILSFQYIGAVLNNLAGADFSAALVAFGEARVLFMGYTPADIGVLSYGSSLRATFLSLANTLKDYNSGKTGPGHCK